jgi:hypothetical protein
LQVFAEKTGLMRQIIVLGMLLTGISSCQSDSETVSGNPDIGATEPRCELRARFFGALSVDIAWTAKQVSCAGMPRPGGAGARLRFAGSTPEQGRPIAIIIAVPDLVKNQAGGELASNVTLIEEGGGRFFSTANLDICMTDIHSTQAVAGNADRSSITGTVYCLSPLAEVNGKSSVSVPQLSFTGLIDWSSS